MVTDIDLVNMFFNNFNESLIRFENIWKYEFFEQKTNCLILFWTKTIPYSSANPTHQFPSSSKNRLLISFQNSGINAQFINPFIRNLHFIQLFVWKKPGNFLRGKWNPSTDWGKEVIFCCKTAIHLQYELVEVEAIKLIVLSTPVWIRNFNPNKKWLSL